MALAVWSLSARNSDPPVLQDLEYYLRSSVIPIFRFVIKSVRDLNCPRGPIFMLLIILGLIRIPSQALRASRAMPPELAEPTNPELAEPTPPELAEPTFQS
ncbi:hypothetical protein F0562_019419 [Nyssa sinensis]|uniref:Uncharacterized protein n=1 Tax=Nyssa sinensis TaxID=561372 RepID=A0A5J4ZCS1_9ASTE|nr:hypothetical protein F0562_019419 [Nyssa sinensis]